VPCVSSELTSELKKPTVQRTATAMLTKIKDKISRMAQRALGIDDMRFKLDVVSSKLDVMSSKLDVMSSKLDVMSSKLDVMSSKLDVITNGLAQLDPKLQNLIERGDSLFWQIRQVSEGLDRLRSFLTWSANRVEPWLPAENFSQTEPDYDLAGFLYNFFPSRVAVDIGAQDSEFAKALSEIGYQVFCFASAPGAFENLSVKATCLPRVEIFDLMIKASEMAAENPLVNARLMSPNGLEANTATGHPLIRTIASLVSSKTLPPQIDILKIDTGYADLEVIKGLGPVRPAAIQIEFLSEDLTLQRGDHHTPVASASEKIKVMRDLEYYWNIIIFRVDSEDFVRMATNLAGTPKQSWGKIFFFQDYQLFLKAFHWCKGALPRFQATALPSR